MLMCFTHQTHSAHPGQDAGAGAAARLQALLTEEEVKFVIVSLGAVRNLLDLHEHGLCKGPSAHVRLQQITEQPQQRSLTVEPPGVVLLRADGRPAPHGPEQSRVGAHEVDVDAGVQVSIWSQQVRSGFYFAQVEKLRV